ncbi:MAG: tetratricopeptide repeat protein [Gammaproteobacteria bacterium]|nr:tetratricopeptide repeat protein [Gammaproteobacteria bacterium]NIT53871.1 tetratricopeptide repeat protein [candidate division Zixibacteria bacterium]NIW44347.1 tetratricopeptide repeat protein [Gammaproteobacteria bacterium]NIX55464.1 tetratricopeptide repeat protein [candidate division Zixibacteria bacterium]
MSQNADAATRAQIMDTEAEVLWKLGRTAEAIEVISRCIELQPDDPYFQEQKNKFQGVTV